MSQLNVSISDNIQYTYGKSEKHCQCKEATEIQTKYTLWSQQTILSYNITDIYLIYIIDRFVYDCFKWTSLVI